MFFFQARAKATARARAFRPGPRPPPVPGPWPWHSQGQTGQGRPGPRIGSGPGTVRQTDRVIHLGKHECVTLAHEGIRHGGRYSQNSIPPPIREKISKWERRWWKRQKQRWKGQKQRRWKKRKEEKQRRWRGKRNDRQPKPEPKSKPKLWAAVEKSDGDPHCQKHVRVAI